MKSIQDAIARGEAKRQQALKAEREAAAKRAEEERRAEEKRLAAYRKEADAWVKEYLADVIEDATAEGRRSLDITKLSHGMRCTDDILATAIRDAGVKVEADSHEHCDYETGRGEGTYYYTYKAVW